MRKRKKKGMERSERTLANTAMSSILSIFLVMQIQNHHWKLWNWWWCRGHRCRFSVHSLYHYYYDYYWLSCTSFISFNRKFSTGNCVWMELILVAWQPQVHYYIYRVYPSLPHIRTLTHMERECENESAWQTHKRIQNENNNRKTKQIKIQAKKMMLCNRWRHRRMYTCTNNSKRKLSTKKTGEEVGKSRMKAPHFTENAKKMKWA